MNNHFNARQWGCDVITDTFDREFIEQLRIFTGNEVLRVPRRLKGITSGQNGRCYWNANICAQTWGGKVIYGWGITFIGGDPAAGFQLYGHACWLTSEGRLVDPTYCPGVSESLFVPYTDKLIINGKVTESICDLCYPRSVKDIEVLLSLVANQHARRFSDCERLGHYPGFAINLERYLGKIVYYDARPYDLVMHIIEGTDPSFDGQVNLMFSPCVFPVEQGAPTKLIHDPSLTLHEMKKRFLKEQKSICSLYAGYDITAEWGGADMVWDSNTVMNPTLMNPSLGNGKYIKDIAPQSQIVSSHSVPTQKKRLKKVVETSAQHNLSLQEVVMLSNPFLYPHPYLLNKAGWVPIPRIKAFDLIPN